MNAGLPISKFIAGPAWAQTQLPQQPAKLTQLLDWPIARRENMDGIKVYLGEIGWLLVRASGTENLLRVYCETSKQETTQRALDAVAKLVRAL